MKKFLSLALALIMALSLVTVSAGAADFADADKIQYTEAVDLMAALGILKGSNGSFNPQGTLTRGAAAKIVAYIALGAEKAEALSGDKMPFTDVAATSSMRPFIAWCYENGIVNGTTATTFEPKSPLSGDAFLKMVLGALQIDGVYTGSNWRYNVESAAETAGLFEGIDEEVKFNGNITREVAAQVAFNAMVEYNEQNAGTFYKIGGMTFGATELTNAAMYKAMMGLDEDIVTVTKTAGKLIEKVHGVATVNGIITKNSANADTKLTTIGSFNYAVETGLDQLGNYVTIYYKPATTAKPYEADKGYTVLSIADSAVKVTIKGSDKAADVKSKLAAVGIVEDTASATIAAVSAAGEVNTAASFGAIKLGVTTGADIAGSSTATIDLYVVDEAVKTTKVALAKVLTKVTDVKATAGEEAIKLKGFNADTWINNGAITNKTTGATQDLVNEYDGIKKNDYVVVTKVGSIYNLEKAQTVTGTPTKINGTKVTIGGVEYDVAGSNYSDKTTGTIALDKELVLYLNGANKYFVATNPTGASGASQNVYVAGVFKITVAATDATIDEFGRPVAGEKQHNTYFAQVVTMDGQEEIYQITKAQYTTLKGEGSDAAVNGLYKLTKATTKTKDTAERITNGKDGIEDSSATSDDVFVEAMFATFGAPSSPTKFGSVTLGAAVKTSSIKLNDNNYYADGVKFLYIEKDLDQIEIAVKEGAQALAKDTVVKTIYTVDSASGKNTVSVVIVEKAYEADTVYTGDIVFVPGYGKQTSTTQVGLFVDPKDDTETKQTAFEHEIYINGVKTKVALNVNEINKGVFYKMTEVVDGVYKLETGLDNVATGLNLSQYKGLGTFTNAAGTVVGLADLDITNAQVVDLRSVAADEKIASATEITTEAVAVVFGKKLSSTSNSVVTIYITELNATPSTLKAVLAAATDGSTIKLGKGNYGDINEHVFAYDNAKNLTIIGGSEVTVSSMKYTVHVNTQPENLTLKNITFTGEGFNAGNVETKGLTFVDCTFKGAAQIAIATSSTDVVIEGCTFEHTDDSVTPIVFNAGTHKNITIENNTFTNGRNAIQLVGIDKDVVIVGNTIKSTGNYALRVNSVAATANVKIAGNDITEVATGYGLLKADAITDGAVVNFNGVAQTPVAGAVVID